MALPPPKKPGPKPKPKAGGSIVGQGFGTGRLHKMALLPDALRDVLLGRKSMYQAGKELGFSDMAIARFIAAIPEEEKLRIVAAAMHDAKLQDALKNAAVANEFGDDVDQDLKWVLRELKDLFTAAKGDEDRLLQLGSLKECARH